MAPAPNPVFIGIRGTVVAVDRQTGAEVWRANLKGSDFVNVILQEGDLFAASRGRLYRFDPSTGDILWSNDLPGLGWGIVSVAGALQVAAGAAETQRRESAAASGAVAATSASH